MLPSVMEDQAEHQAEQHSFQDTQDTQGTQGTSVTATLPGHSILDDPASKSVPTLRFPRPQGSQVLANWVSTSSPDIMASPPSPFYSSQDDENSLADSAFEIITRVSSENGSLDDPGDDMSEELSEYERYPHPDEVRAFEVLDDMSYSTTSVATDSELATDEEEEQHQQQQQQQKDDITYTDSSLHSYQDAQAHEFLQDPLGDSSAATIFAPTPTVDLSTTSIEFSEPEDVDVHIDKTSVKHTIKEFSQHEAADFFELAGLGQPPQRVSATIRQTMSQRCLSTHETFRVLYVGNVTYKAEIVLKLSRAITCSSSMDHNENKTLHKNTEGVYNIIPVPFGTAKDRDVELMEASAFQIKVDTCLAAEKNSIGSRYFRGDTIYSLTVDGGNGGKKFFSVPAPGPEGATVQPAWSLPHVAVFCVSEDEDDNVYDLQRTAAEFCERHAIPSIFISDHPVYAASTVAARWENYTNEHAICLSLESRDWKTERRFPIDLDSFINIDNRQMNQNLAYLTGLQEPASLVDEKMKDAICLDGSELKLPNNKFEEWLYGRVVPWLSGVPKCPHGVDIDTRRRVECYIQKVFGVLRLMLLVLLGTAVTRFSLMQFSGLPESETTNTSPAAPSLTTSASVATVTINYTSTKTVSIPSTESSSFGGLLSDIAHTVSADWPKNTLCSAEMYSDSEVLIKLPFGTKETWLAKGAIDVDVFRGETLVPSRLSSSAEGIIIQIPDEEAYGVLNVSVLTTRKPKINETFAVDFGTPLLTEVWDITQGVLQGVAKKVGDSADGMYRLMVETDYGHIVAPAEKLVLEKSQAWLEKINSIRDAIQSYSSQVTDEVAHMVRESVGPEADTLVKNAQQIFVGQQRHFDKLRQNGELAILKAQVQSKLWWLKVQGKDEAYHEYDRKARNFMSKKYVHVSETKDQATGRWQA